jgi:uncharacterized protein YdeI (BOF family)
MRLRRKTLRGAAVVVATVGCLVGLMTGTAFAAVTEIGNVVSDPTAYLDQTVTVSGTIDQVIEGNEFTLKDGTGTIKVEAGPSWYKDFGFYVGQSITITGEVDLGKDGTGAAEIDVFTVEADGQTTTVREAGGPPPWAGRGHNGQTPGAGAPDDDNDSD